ncbi:unnamed protein product, partial [Allacma fusca]
MERLNSNIASASGSERTSRQPKELNSLSSCNSTNINYTDGYNFKEDPRYKNLCSNRRRTVTYQSFAPFKEDQDRVHSQLSQLLEYDFQRRTPLFRKSSSVEDF